MIHVRTFLIGVFLLCFVYPPLSAAGEEAGCVLCRSATKISPDSPFHELAKEYHWGRSSSSAGPHWFCEWYKYYDPSASTLGFWQILPSSKWAVKFSPINYCTVWTAEIHFDVKKNSQVPVQDTLDIFIQEASSPYSLIYKTYFLVNPYFIESLYPLYPPLGSPYSVGNPIINTKRDFLVCAQMRGGPTDSVKWFFKTPALNPSRSLRFTGSTTVQTASQAVGQSVDMYLQAELCIHLPIPVELMSFRAESRATGTFLSWETAGEFGNYGFNVERGSTKDGPWEIRGFVPGRGNSTVKQQYSFEDRPETGELLPAPAQLWYRLIQLDYDGTTEEYPPLLVSTAADIPDGFVLDQNFPNPFGNSSPSGYAATTFRYSLPFETEIELTVTDVLGRTLAVLESGVKTAGVHQFQWNGRDLRSGTYFARLRADSWTVTRKFVFQR